MLEEENKKLKEGLANTNTDFLLFRKESQLLENQNRKLKQEIKRQKKMIKQKEANHEELSKQFKEKVKSAFESRKKYSVKNEKLQNRCDD